MGLEYHIRQIRSPSQASGRELPLPLAPVRDLVGPHMRYPEDGADGHIGGAGNVSLLYRLALVRAGSNRRLHLLDNLCLFFELSVLLELGAGCPHPATLE